MRYRIAGNELECNHCGGADFKVGKAQLNTAVLTFLNWDWMNKSAKTFCCTNCGRIEWFLPTSNEPEEIAE